MAAVHRHFGLGGIALLSLLVLGLTSLCIYRSAVEESEHRLIAISFTGLAMAAGTIHWLARPHLVTPLFAAVFCWVLNRVDKRPSGERFLLLLPALTILWVNLHGGFFVGTILLMTYGLGAAAEELFHGTRENAWVRARKYLFTAGACVVASLVNPYGYRLHIHVAQYLGSSFYFKRISEFQSADFHAFTAAYFETLLVLAIAASSVAFGQGQVDSRAPAAELGTPGIVFGSQYSDLCRGLCAWNRSGNARLVAAFGFTLASRLARETRREFG